MMEEDANAIVVSRLTNESGLYSENREPAKPIIEYSLTAIYFDLIICVKTDMLKVLKQELGEPVLSGCALALFKGGV